MTPDPKQLRTIAKRCREACVWFVDHAGDRHLDCSNSRTLKAFCAIAASFVTEVLRREGLEAQTIQNQHETHCWTECGAFSIDITLAQFNGPCVSVKPIHRKGYPTTFTNWPKGQQPTPKRIKKLLSIY